MAELQRSTAMPVVTALSGGKGGDFYPLPLTRAWLEDYRRWFVAQLRAPAVLAEARARHFA